MVPESLTSDGGTDIFGLNRRLVVVAALVGIVVVGGVAAMWVPSNSEDGGGNAQPDNTPVNLSSVEADIWEESNEWLAANTPEVGNYGGAGNADVIEYTEQDGWPDGDSFDYPEGAYSVLAWWDYSQLITVQGERIPHSNLFQQNARPSSAFLTAQNESQAELYLDAISAGVSPTDKSNEAELRAAVEKSDDKLPVQYIMIDDESAAAKFSTIASVDSPGYSDYLKEEERIFLQGRGENQTRNSREVLVGGDYYDTMLARLYLEDAKGLEHYRLIHESSRYSIVGFFGNVQASQRIDVFEDVTESGEETATSLADTIDSFEQARAGDFGIPLGPEQFIHDPYVVSSVKTFERVEGATLTGETDLNGSVEATVTMRTETNRTFTHTQTAPIEDGSFEMTVSYPTDEMLTPADGYANSSVRAEGGYTLTVFNETGGAAREATNVAVSESAVQTGDTIEVELANNPDALESAITEIDVTG